MDRAVFDNEKLISLVEPSPCLWDTSHEDYFDRNKKQRCWVEIAKQMCDNFEGMTSVQQNEYGKDLQKKWRNLRNSFARELSRRKKKKSGDGTTWKTYVFFDQLSFLMQCPSNRETSSNITEGPMENDETLPQDPNEEVILSSTPISKKRKNTCTDDSSEMVQVLKASLDQRQKNENLLDKDDDRHFLLSLLADFKRVPIEKKLDVKLTIIQVIRSAILPTHGVAVSHTPYISEPYSIYPSASFTPPQTYSTIPQHFIQIPQPPHTFQKINQIPQSPRTSQKINQIPQLPYTSQQTNQIPQLPRTSQQIIQTPQSPHTSQENSPIPQSLHTSQQISQTPQSSQISQQIIEIPQSPHISQQNNPIPQSPHTSQQNYQLLQFPSKEPNLQQKIITPLQSPFSVGSSDNMSTDGSLLDLLTEY